MSRPKGSKNKPKGTVDKAEAVIKSHTVGASKQPITLAIEGEIPLKRPELPPAKDGRALAKINPTKDFFVDDMELFPEPKEYAEGYAK